MNLRKLARGRPCMVRIPKVCNFNPETTVLAHLNGAGMGRKAHDLHGAWTCAACHQWLDGGFSREASKNVRDLYHLEAVIRTQEALIEEGLL